jgi:hypothetical protein
LDHNKNTNRLTHRAASSVMRAGAARWTEWALRLSLATAVLSPVGDRLGAWGPHGSPHASWGDWYHFRIYADRLNWYIPAAVQPAAAVLATAGEAIFADVLRMPSRRFDRLAIPAEDATTSVPGTAVRARDHRAVRVTVSPVFTELWKRGRAPGRTQSRRRSGYHRGLGAALRTRTGSPLPPGASHDESVVEGR